MSSDMLREASDSLFEYLVESFPQNRFYSRSDIEQDPMPPLLAHFLTHTLQQKLEVEVEHLRSVRSPWFNYDHAQVQHSYKAFVASLAQHSFIPAEEWRANLKRATKLVIAHLVLPTHTLVEYIFHEDEGPLPAPVIYKQLVYFAAYPYLREAVEAFIKQRQLKEIDRNRFSSLLMQIDKHMTSSYTVDDWIRLLKPMFDLMRRIPFTNRQGTPVELLAMFFGDKDAYDIQERLYVEKELHRTTMINEIALRRVIEGSVEPYEQEIISTPAPAPEPEPVPQPTQAPPQREESDVFSQDTVYQQAPAKPPESRPAPPEPAPVVKPEPKPEPQPAAGANRPLWEQFQQTPTHTRPEDNTNGAKTSTPKPDKPSVPLWMQFQKKPEIPVPNQPAAHTRPAAKAPSPASENQHVAQPKPAQAPPPQPVQKARPAPKDPALMTLEQLEFSVLGLYGTSNRDMFIEHLFAGSAAGYQQMLRQLHLTENWTTASSLIADNVFKKHNVNIYSPAAIMFTESVEEQYKLN